jgi:hypothetical protein
VIPAGSRWRTSCPPSSARSRSAKPRPSGLGKRKSAAAIRQDRWEEVKREAFVHVAYQRNADRLVADLARRNTAAAMRAYADEIAAHAAGLEASDAQAAREWADWIRQHAEAPTR